ncbi:MAG: sterol desaturase family protein [Myxococcota bacterium]|nr:sterol desaturase family protein [Myxococcota bacterium]
MLDWMTWMPAGANMDDGLIFAVTLWTIHQVFAVGTSVFFNLMHTNNWFSAYRFADGRAPPNPLYRSAWKEWVLNHILILPVFMGLVLYPLFVMRGGNMTMPWPSPLEVMIHIAVCVFVNETIFYFSHRFLHSKKMFRLIHRKHHAFRHVRPVCSEYAHPFENALNLLAMYAGLVFMGSHFLTWGIWVAIRIYETNDGHSGYEHIDSASRHAYHHLFPTKGCYGTALGFWDWLLGTDKNWREWKSKREGRDIA